MDLPISELIAELKLRPLEQQIIATSELKHALWLHYVDDTFLIWNHGIPALKKLLDNANNVETNMQFILAIEEGTLPFLDVE